MKTIGSFKAQLDATLSCLALPCYVSCRQVSVAAGVASASLLCCRRRGVRISAAGGVASSNGQCSKLKHELLLSHMLALDILDPSFNLQTSVLIMNYNRHS